jgi:hypothetical protein
MSRWVLGAVVATACLYSGTASGQVALGVGRTPGITVHRPDPPRPDPAPQRPDPPSRFHGERSPAPQPTGGDLFLAGPDTYAPYNPKRPSRVHPYRTFSGYFPTPYVPDFSARETITVNIAIRPEPAATYTTEPERPVTPDPLPAPPTVTSRPGVPKTFYVIPRCYAGDRRPSADWLPAGCDIRRLRVIEAGTP